MELPKNTLINKITRIRHVYHEDKKVPITIEYAYVPDHIAPRIIQHNLEERSLFEILSEEYNHQPDREEQKLEIVYANEKEEKMLNVDNMTALVLKRGLTFDRRGDVIQYIHAIMNKDWVSFYEEDPVIARKTREVLYAL